MWNIQKLIKKGDYLYCVVKEHPKANEHGYVLHHRVVMENYLGRQLTDNEVVHHKDENKKNNSIDNLEVLDKREHSRKHGIERRIMDKIHGTLSSYRYCKCSACKLAKNVWQKNYMKNRKA